MNTTTSELPLGTKVVYSGPAGHEFHGAIAGAREWYGLAEYKVELSDDGSEGVFVWVAASEVREDAE